MTGVGNLIKAIRVEKKISVLELCEGICTERFMYMIENNNRMPSADIIRRIGNRLGLNVYDYLEFIGYKKPVLSKQLIERSKKYRNGRAIALLEELTCQMESLEDHGKDPLRSEIVINQVFIEIFHKNNLQIAYKQVESEIIVISGHSFEWVVKNNYFLNDYYFINLMNYQFIILRYMGEDQKAQMILDYLWQQINEVCFDKKYEVLYVSIAINYLYDHIFILKSVSHKKEIDALLAFQRKNNQLNRIFFTYYLLSGHYYNIGEIDKAKEYFKLMVAAGISVSDQTQYTQLIQDIGKDYLNTVSPSASIEIKIC